MQGFIKNAAKQAVRRAQPTGERILTTIAVSAVSALSAAVEGKIRDRVNAKRGERYEGEQGGDHAAGSRNGRGGKAGAEGMHTAAEIWHIFQRQGERCYYCRQRVSPELGFEVDHRIPLSRGGGNGPDNLVVACRTCNRRKGARMPEDFIP